MHVEIVRGRAVALDQGAGLDRQHGLVGVVAADLDQAVEDPGRVVGQGHVMCDHAPEHAAARQGAGGGTGRATRELGFIDALGAFLFDSGSEKLNRRKGLRDCLEAALGIRRDVDIDLAAALHRHVDRADRGDVDRLVAGERIAFHLDQRLSCPGELELLDVEVGGDPERIAIVVERGTKQEDDPVAIRPGQDIHAPALALCRHVVPVAGKRIGKGDGGIRARRNEASGHACCQRSALDESCHA